jgi:hypothetical protein
VPVERTRSHGNFTGRSTTLSLTGTLLPTPPCIHTYTGTHIYTQFLSWPVCSLGIFIVFLPPPSDPSRVCTVCEGPSLSLRTPRSSH